MSQSIRDARENEIPIVMHRKNYAEWKVTMRFSDWIELYRAWEKENERTHKVAQVDP